MIRQDPKLREAYEVVKKDRQRARKERKAAASAHIKALLEVNAPGRRQPREKEAPYLAWLRRQPCVICGSTPSDAAHLRHNNAEAGRLNPGGGTKSHDRHANPLCRRHHSEQHGAGDEAAWWASYGLDGDASAARHYAAFLAGQPKIPSRPFNSRKQQAIRGER